ncbi:serine-type D-Ala-D-Ala carboxypeptidase [Clostridia bacterium]|nr:serine-type D-Ala-D-Ala carboxypeptidase [Clostridia bacterium]
MIKKCTALFIAFLITSTSVFAASAPKEPTVEAIGAVLLDGATGRVLWAKNADKPLAMASTTKIMTAVLALEYGKPDEIVTVSKRAASAPEVNMDLRVHEEIKLQYLIYALMLQSSNDAAVAISEHIGGSVENFCAMMTKRAAELGATDTVFETPNGLDSGDHHSTAHDMALITRYALSLEGFLPLINTSNFTAESSKGTHYIVNKNRLLNEYEGANGVKTGFTGKAGHCFVGSARRGDMQLISVVLASGWGGKGREQKWLDTKEILNYGFDNYKYSAIIHAGDPAGALSVSRSKTPSITLCFADEVILPLRADETSKVAVDKNYPVTIKAPVQKGQAVGTASIKIDKAEVAEVDIITKEGAERHDLKTSLEKVVNAVFDCTTTKPLDLVLPEF